MHLINCGICHQEIHRNAFCLLSSLSFHFWVFTPAVCKHNVHLQGCKHTLCLGGICLGIWEMWRALLLVLSPTFHTDLQASPQNCFSLKEEAGEKSECESFERIFLEKTHSADGCYLDLYPFLLPQTTQVWADSQQLQHQKYKCIIYCFCSLFLSFFKAWVNKSHISNSLNKWNDRSEHGNRIVSKQFLLKMMLKILLAR